MGAAEGGESCYGGAVETFGVEEGGIRCARGGRASVSGDWSGSFAFFALLTVVAAVWLLWQFLAGCLDDWAGAKPARLKTHQDAVRAAETEDVRSAHDGCIKVTM